MAYWTPELTGYPAPYGAQQYPPPAGYLGNQTPYAPAPTPPLYVPPPLLPPPSYVYRPPPLYVPPPPLPPPSYVYRPPPLYVPPPYGYPPTPPLHGYGYQPAGPGYGAVPPATQPPWKNMFATALVAGMRGTLGRLIGVGISDAGYDPGFDYASGLDF